MRSNRRRISLPWPVSFSIAFSLTAACSPAYDPCFTPASVIDDLRLLAVRADPPEALVDLDAGLVPPVAVRALIAGAADPQSTIQLVAHLCSPTADLQCPDSSTEIDGPVSLPGAREGTLELQVSPAIVEQARDDDPLHGYGGTRVQLQVEARVAGSDGSASAFATKTLLFSDAETTPAPNQPIEIGSVDLSIDGGSDGTALQGELEEMLVGHSYGLRPRLLPLADGGSPLEQYQVTDLNGAVVQLREQVSYDFFAGSNLLFGDLPITDGVPVGVYIEGAAVADEPQPGAPDPPDGLVRATPMLESVTRVWVVGRDSRGAVAWISFDARIDDLRQCDAPNGEPCPEGMVCCQDPFIGCQ